MQSFELGLTGVSSVILQGSFGGALAEVTTLFEMGSLMATIRPADGLLVVSNSDPAGCSVTALLSSVDQAAATSLRFDISAAGVPAVPRLAAVPLVAASAASTAACSPVAEASSLEVGLAGITQVSVLLQDGSSLTLLTATGEVIQRNAGTPPMPPVTGLSPGITAPPPAA